MRRKLSAATGLDAEQRWLVDVVTSQRKPRNIAKHLGGSVVPDAVGLATYRDGYVARLEECLADDFPVLWSLLGNTAAATLAKAVIMASPSTDLTLNRYSRRMLTYLRHHPRATAYGRLAYDLARVEWALVEAIHAPLKPSVSADDVARVSPEAWAQACLETVPALRLISSRWQLSEALRQHHHNEPVTVPTRTSGVVAVVRGRDGLRHFQFTVAEGRLLRLLMQRQPLGEALAASRLDPNAISAVFTRLISAGFFAAIIH